MTSRPHIDALYKKVERGESDVVKKYKDDQKAVISSVAKDASQRQHGEQRVRQDLSVSGACRVSTEIFLF